MSTRQATNLPVEAALIAYRQEWEAAAEPSRPMLTAAEQPSASQQPANPIGDGSRDGSGSPRGRRCPVCGSPVLSSRARFCSGTCRQAAWRRRHAGPSVESVELPPRRPKVYECPECEQRYLDEWRCPDCNLFCRGLGHGGPCPHCDELVVVAELLGEVSR